MLNPQKFEMKTKNKPLCLMITTLRRILSIHMDDFQMKIFCSPQNKLFFFLILIFCGQLAMTLISRLRSEMNQKLFARSNGIKEKKMLAFEFTPSTEKVKQYSVSKKKKREVDFYVCRLHSNFNVGWLYLIIKQFT